MSWHKAKRQRRRKNLAKWTLPLTSIVNKKKSRKCIPRESKTYRLWTCSSRAPASQGRVDDRPIPKITTDFIANVTSGKKGCITHKRISSPPAQRASITSKFFRLGTPHTRITKTPTSQHIADTCMNRSAHRLGFVRSWTLKPSVFSRKG